MLLRHALVLGTMSMALVTADAASAADQTLTGLVIVIDRTTNEIIVKQEAPKSGASDTVGSNARAEATRFKLRDAVPETLHAGEKVSVTYTQNGDVNTAIKVEEAKD